MLRLKSPDRIGAARPLPTTTALDTLRRASGGIQSAHGQAMSV
jgi:hypothetical protein